MTSLLMHDVAHSTRPKRSKIGRHFRKLNGLEMSITKVVPLKSCSSMKKNLERF